MTDAPAAQRSRWNALTAVLLTAVASSLVGAAVQVGVQMVNAVLLSRLVFTGRDVVWMAPVSWTAFGLLVAAPVAVAALLVPQVNWRALSLGCFAGGVVLFLLAPFEEIATWAAALLGVGVGVQLVRVLPTGSARWPMVLRRTIAGLTAAFALAAVWQLAARAVHERREIAGLPSAETAAANVLLVVFDVVRAANLSAYGYGRPTSPTLEQIASNGVTFDHAYAVAPWTLPSHASMFTGRYPTELLASYRRGLEDGTPTLAEAFHGRGYRTAGFTANATYTGWDTRLDRGFERWSDYRRTVDQVRYSGLPWQTTTVRELRGARSLREAWVALRYFPLRAPTNLSFDIKRTPLVSREFLDWQASLPPDRPFFAFLNFYDAHRPRYAPPEISKRFTGGRNLQFDRYDGAIAFMDEQLGLLMDTLRARGALDNTVIAVVGDHGELLGEHDFVGHSNMLYRDLIWVPFLIRYPRRIAGGTHVATAVSLRDLGATLLDLAGALTPPHLEGASLAPLATGATIAARSPVFSYAHQGANIAARFPNSTGPLFSLVLDSLHYIRHPREELLFNMVRDGEESHNLLADPKVHDVLEEARRVVDSITRTGKPR